MAGYVTLMSLIREGRAGFACCVICCGLGVAGLWGRRLCAWRVHGGWACGCAWRVGLPVCEIVQCVWVMCGDVWFLVGTGRSWGSKIERCGMPAPPPPCIDVRSCA